MICNPGDNLVPASSRSCKAFITTVITVFNRAHCVSAAISSALSAFEDGVVVVVDDASTDGSILVVEKDFATKIKSGNVIFEKLRNNIGVTGAKNFGFSLARSDWVVFLDSDDRILPGAGALMVDELRGAIQFPVVFFRCKNQYDQFVGTKPGERIDLDLQTYLKYGSYGEALTVVNKRLQGEEPPYPEELRGYEGLGCCRMIRKYGPALLSPLTAREYFQGGADALSSYKGMLKRSKYLASGHLTLVREFGPDMGFWAALSYRLKAAIYYLAHFFAF
jgi:glycosyltransferase involved in cell wall biosynthesis